MSSMPREALKTKASKPGAIGVPSSTLSALARAISSSGSETSAGVILFITSAAVYPSIVSAPTLKIWMTPLASVAMLEKLALLKIALCRAPVLSRASVCPTSVFVSSPGAVGVGVGMSGSIRRRTGVRGFCRSCGVGGGNREEERDVGDGNGEEEAGAVPELALRPDPAAVRRDDAPRDREAKPGPVVLHVAAAPVALEEVRQILLADPRPVVGDREQDLVVPARRDSKRDVPALGCGLGGVADQVGQDLKNAVVVAEDSREVRLDVRRHLQSLVLGDALEAGERFLDHRARILRPALDREVSGLDAREVEQVIDEPEHALGRALDSAHGLRESPLLRERIR